MTYYQFATPVQAIGLACVPVDHLPDVEIMARRSVAVAVVSIASDAEGRPTITASCPTAARDPEFPLPYLVNEALVAGAETIVSPADRAVLAADASARRFFVEPSLARLTSGETVIDPASLAGDIYGDEAVLYQRLHIPTLARSDASNAALWDKRLTLPLKTAALAEAVSRLMLWAHFGAFREAEAGIFFETMLALRDWMHGQVDSAPELYGWATSRPVLRAQSFEHDYRQALKRGQGEPWITFESGLSIV
ncbi:hypothetical protein [Stakelama marina]|uniref:Uncharacterized protein n=1 Tax=Stakelama marina TaxID=2826939 RepID=A0A8T4IGL1_9SPHN|nr:hypothetical protein [Stakelama marina]MBR0553763.1 hypothetical protein [Stakelama marina]